jgi:hypothetical protein
MNEILFIPSKPGINKTLMKDLAQRMKYRYYDLRWESIRVQPRKKKKMLKKLAGFKK